MVQKANEIGGGCGSTSGAQNRLRLRGTLAGVLENRPTGLVHVSLHVSTFANFQILKVVLEANLILELSEMITFAYSVLTEKPLDFDPSRIDFRSKSDHIFYDFEKNNDVYSKPSLSVPSQVS